MHHNWRYCHRRSGVSTTHATTVTYTETLALTVAVITHTHTATFFENFPGLHSPENYDRWWFVLPTSYPFHRKEKNSYCYLLLLL